MGIEVEAVATYTVRLFECAHAPVGLRCSGQLLYPLGSIEFELRLLFGEGRELVPAAFARQRPLQSPHRGQLAGPPVVIQSAAATRGRER